MSKPKNDLHCSVFCQQEDIPAIGTGRKPEPGIFGGFLLVEIPGYWDAKIEIQDGILGEIGFKLSKLQEAQDLVFRMQAIQSVNRGGNLDDSELHIILYRWASQTREEYKLPLGKFSYQKQNNEYPFKPSTDTYLQDCIALILTQTQPQWLVPSNITRDILICSHAQRDKCCGRYGYPIFKKISSEFQNEPNTQIWQSSHITGHRSAPTMLDLPQGIFWGYMTYDMTRKMINREKMTQNEIRYHFRGGTELKPYQQLVDREGFIQYGFEWFEFQPKIVEVPSIDTDISSITISRGKKSITREIKTQPTIIEIGETHCGFMKPATVFTLIE